MNQIHTSGKKRFLAWILMCVMLFNYFSGVTLTAQESQGNGNTVVIEGGSVVIGGNEPTEPLPGTATVIERVESLLETEPAGTEEATQPEVTEAVTEPEETGEATQPEATEAVTEPEGTEEETQPQTTEGVTEPEETQDVTEPEVTEEVTEPEETEAATEPEETEAAMLPTDSQWFLFDMETKTITGYSEDPMAPLDVIIPVQLYGVDVVAIGEMAFAGLAVRSVTLEAGSRLKRVESKAFYNCTSLAVLELPESVQVAEDALEGCTLLGYGPTTAEDRAQDCVVYIGGVAMDASTDGTEVSYYVNGGTVSTTDPGSWNAKLWYDSANSRMTLSLNGLEVTGVASSVCFEAYGAGIFTEYKGAFCIDLTGMNTATGVPYSDGTCQGVYTMGNYHKLTITGTGTLKAIGQDPTGYNFGLRTTDLTVESGTVIGIASDTSGTASIGVQGSSITINGGRVEGTGGNATSYSKGIYSSSGDFTVTNATVIGVSGDAKKTYGLDSYENLILTNADVTGRCDGTAQTRSCGVYSRYKTVSTDSTVTATAGTATQGDSKGLWAGAYSSTSTNASYSLTITGGTVTATGGTGNGGASVGIQSTSYVKITGGTVNATAGTSNGGNSTGIYTIKSSITITDDAKVTAQGGETDQSSYGMYSYTTMEIEDASEVTATAGKAGIASYGAFVIGNFTLQDTASLTAEGGEVTGEPDDTDDSWQYRSVGLWMGAASETESGPTYKDDLCVISGGRLVAKSADTAPGFSGALGFYDVMNIIYTDSVQTDSTWYQWRTSESDKPVHSSDTAYTHKGDWIKDTSDEDYTSPHYLCIEPKVILADCIVYVGGVKMEANVDGSLSSWYKDGTVTTTKPSSWTARLQYDENTERMTLTLSGLTVSGVADDETTKGAAIYAEYDGLLCLNLLMTNTVKGKKYNGDSVGIYTTGENHTLLVSSTSGSGKVTVQTAAANNCIAVSTADLVVESGSFIPKPLQASAGNSTGIYAASVHVKGGKIDSSNIIAPNGTACGIDTYSGGVTVSNATILSSASLSNEAYAIRSKGDILVENAVLSGQCVGSEKVATDTYGIYCEGEMTVTGSSTVKAIGGISTSGNSQGLWVKGNLKLEGGDISGKTLDCKKGYSMGIHALSDVIITNDAVVTAEGRVASVQNAGLYVEKDLYMDGAGQLTATGYDAQTSSYGIVVCGNFYQEDDTGVTATSGKITTTPTDTADAWKYRSAGIWLGAENETSSGVGDGEKGNSMVITGGRLIAQSADTAPGFSGAVGFYDAKEIKYSDGNQADGTWYQWKTSADDAATRSSDTPYTHKGDWIEDASEDDYTSPHYLCIEPKVALADCNLYISNKLLGASYDGTLVSYYTNDGTVTKEEPSSWNAKLWYDTTNERLTLTLQDLNATGVNDHPESHAAGIYTERSVYVEVNGTNTVEGAVHYFDKTDANKTWNVSYGMYTGGLTLVGSGTLDVHSVPTPTSVPNCSQRYGIYSTTTFQIDSGTLVVNSSKTKEYNYGSYCPSHAIHAEGDIVINGGSVTATTEYGSYGTSAIRSHGGNVTINGGTVNAYAANARSGGYGGCIAIYAYKTLTINDGTVTAKCDQENTTLAGGYGIYARESGVYIHGGTVKAYGPAVFCQGYTSGEEDEGEGLLNSFGIGAGYAAETGKVVITGGDVYAEGGSSEEQLGGGSVGIGGYQGVEISGGTVETKSTTAAYPVGIEGRKGPVAISGDAKVTVNSGSCIYGSSYGLIGVGIDISGGTTIVNAGSAKTTYGLYCKVNTDEDGNDIADGVEITISGNASVTATAGAATEYSYGIYTRSTRLTVKNQAQVEITSGNGERTYGVVLMPESSWCDVKDDASLTVNTGNGTERAYGLYLNKKGSLLTVEDNAKFSATSGEAADYSVAVYLNSSWMDIKDKAEVTATAGKATDTSGKSIGIFEWQYGNYPLEFTGGTLIAKADTSSSFASALTWYETSSCKGDTHITFSNSEQPDAQWYQYKTSESDADFTLASVTAFNDDGNYTDGTTGTAYLHIEPLTAKKVIFHIEGGTWSDGSTDDIVTMVILRDENGAQSATGSGSLTAPVGMIPNTTGWKGFWEETPPETVSGMEEVTYTYRFAEYIVYVGGKPMYADKDGAVNYFVNSGKKVTATEPSGGWNAKLWYDTDHSRLTLSLHRLDTNGIPGDVDSKGAGIFTTHDLYVDNVGSSKSYGKVCDGAVYGIYAGNLTVAGVDYLEFNAGDNSTKDTQKVYGIYSTGSVTIENVDAAAVAYRSTDLTAAIYAEKNVTVNSGSITAIYSGSLENGAGVDADHAFGIFAVKNCYINGGTVKVTGATDVVTMGMNVAIASRDGNVEIRGGKVTATAGKQDGNTQAQTSTAIMGGASKYLASSSAGMSGKIIISGDAVVVATGGTSVQNGVTRGLYGYDGVEISDTANVTASTGSDSVYAIGIDSAYDVSITDKAHVTATAQDAQFHSYGTFVWGNFTMTGDPVFITTGGNSSREDISADLALFDGSYRARSAGMWMGITFTSELDDASNGDSRNNFTITGGTFIAQCGSAWDYHFDGALGFYSNGTIDYGSNPTWYRWETHAPDGTVAKDSSGTTRYDSHMGDWYTEWKDSTGTYVSPHYLRIERDTPAVKKVTFKIENGTWDDGTTADIELDVPLLDADGNQDLLGTGTLNVPTGMIPNTTGQTGFWDVTPPTTVTGTDPVTYTYRFADGIVWVGGQAMWATMDGTSTYFVNTTRAVTESAPASWDAKCWYDGSKLTLTVDGLDTTGVDDDETSKGAGIYTTHDLYLDVQNENKVVSGRIPGSVGSVLNGKIYYDAFGIYSSNLTIGGTGTLDVTGDDIQGSSYGIYTVGNLTVDSGTLNLSSGKTVHIQDQWNFYSYAMSATKDIVINDGDITATSNGAEMTTTAIRAGNDLTIMDGTVKAYAVNNLYGTFDRRNYVIYAENNITINDGDITAIGSGKTTSYESTAIRAGKKNITINGGNVYAKGADCAQEQSRGIAAPNYTASNTSQNYVDGQIYINGGTVVAISGVSSSGYNQGICGYNGITITGGDVTAQALGGSFSIGLYCDYNLTISNDAVITATSGDATFTSVGTYVYNNFHMSGTAKLTTTAGNSLKLGEFSPHKSKSVGLYMTSGTNEPGTPATSMKNTFTITGGTLIAQSGTAPFYTGAVAFYDVAKMTYSDANQPDDKWYQWKTDPADPFTLSANTAYVHDGDIFANTGPTFLHIEATSAEKKVTFKVVDGTWSDGTTDDIVVNVPLVDADGNTDINGSGDLSGSIPTGMIPNTAGMTGFWDVTPPDTVTGTDPVTYTYRFADGIVWVGGKPMWANKSGTVTYFVNSTREVTETAPETYHAKCWFNGNDLTLTVDGLDTTGVEDDATTKAAAIYTAYKGLTIDVNGTNTVEGSITKTPTNLSNAQGKIYREITYGVYVNGVTFTGDGTFTNKAFKTTDKNYGVYSADTFTMKSGTLNANSGEACINASGRPGCSVAIYAAKDVVIDNGHIVAKSSGADSESSAIWTDGKLTINDGIVDASSDFVKGTSYGSTRAYSYGYVHVIHAESDITIKDGTVSAVGTSDLLVANNGGHTFAIASETGDVTIDGGTVTAISPSAEGNFNQITAAIMAPADRNYYHGAVYINGGTVTAKATPSGTHEGSAYGIWGFNGVYITGGTVDASTGKTDGYTYGIKSDYPFEISGDAKVTATAGEATWGSCGLFVYSDFSMTGNPTLIVKAEDSTTTEANYNDQFATKYHCYSYGLWMSYGQNEDESSVNESDTFLITGGTLIASCGTARYCNLAIAFKDVIDGKMTYSNSAQPNDQWYRWKTDPNDPFTLSKNTAYVHDGDILAKTGPTYVHIEPTSDDRQEDGIVWVGGMRMDASRDGTEVCYFQNTGKVVTQALSTDTPPENWNAKLWFDTSDSNNVRLVLTLDSLDTSGITDDVDSYGAGIYTAYADTLYIDLIGENKAVGARATVVLDDSFGVFVGKMELENVNDLKDQYFPLVIESSDGGGSLTTSAVKTEDYAIGICAGDLEIKNCTVKATGGLQVGEGATSYGSYGIRVDAEATKGSMVIDNATVTATTNTSMGLLGSRGISVEFGNLEIKNNSDVTASGYLAMGWDSNVPYQFIFDNAPSYGIYVHGKGYQITVTDSTVNATSTSTKGQSVGIATFKGDITFNNSTVTATSGKGNKSSAGVLANVCGAVDPGAGGDGSIFCGSGTMLTATSGTSDSVSAGIQAYKKIEITGGAQVTATDDSDYTSYKSMGIYCGTDLLISGESVVEATAIKAYKNSFGVCVQGKFHMENSTTSDNHFPKLTATAGNVSSTSAGYRSAGIWMAGDTEVSSGATAKTDTFIISSGTMIAQAGTCSAFAGAVGFYDVQSEKITYVDANQTNSTWYRWKTAVANPFTWSGTTPYDENLDWLNGTNIPTYLHIEPGEEEPRQQDAIVWVGGKPMDASEDGLEVSYFQNTDKVVIQTYSTATEPETWNAKLWYDTTNSRMTLTLKGLDTFGIDEDADSHGAGIFTAYVNPLYVDLIGENTAKGAIYTTVSDGECSMGVYTTDTNLLVICSSDGTGVLRTSGVDAEDASYGIMTNMLTIQDCTVDATSGKSISGNSTGIDVEKEILTAENCTITATSNAALDMSAAIDSVSKTINLKQATVTATVLGASGRSYGIRSDGNLLADDSTITVNGSTEPSTWENVGIWGKGRVVLTNCTTNVTAGSTTGVGYDSEGISCGDGSTADTRRLEVVGGEVTVTVGSSTNGASKGLYSTGPTIIREDAKVTVTSGADSQKSYGLYTCADLKLSNTAQVEVTSKDAAIFSCGVLVYRNFSMVDSPVLLATAGKVTSQPDDPADAWKYRSAGIWLGDKSETSSGAAASNSFTITGGKLISKSADTAPGFSGALGFYDVDVITYSDTNQPDDTWYMWKIDTPTNPFTISSRKAYVHKGDWLLDAAGVDANGDPYVSTHYLHIEPKVAKKVTFKVVNGTWSDGTDADIEIEIPLVDASGNPDPNGTGKLEISDIPTGMLPLPGFDFGKWDPVPDDTTPIAATDPAVYTYSFVTAAPMTAVDTGASGMGLMLLALAMLSALTMFAVGQTRRRLGVSGKS